MDRSVSSSKGRLRVRGSARAMLAVALALGASAASAAGGYGYTWGKVWHDATLGIDLVGNGASGNPISGDTQCTVALPLLCVNIDQSPRPNYAIDTINQGLPAAGYRGWIGGHIATTLPVVGSTLTSSTAGDGVCAIAFGPAWRMAEFHDGHYLRKMDETHFYGNASNSSSPWPDDVRNAGGYDFYAFGDVRDDTRYWVRISDQRANCWNP